ncbi:MAG TPA: D-aminoacyl-tRNA deacylase [Candidatus Dormibacteraeota bacterium]|nr:D-aminoacyl-tRNA deacylase [Candidatus Dormibacteraeota bacterium]
MRAVVQRVRQASVRWRDEDGHDRCRRIGRGLAVLVGVGPTDEPVDAERLADKILRLRIFPDGAGRFNLSLEEVSGEALVVSQFTLYADVRRGRRPSFTGAAAPARAEELCERFASRLAAGGIPTQTGSFGARMLVSLENEGPVTLVLSTDPWETRIHG